MRDMVAQKALGGLHRLAVHLVSCRRRGAEMKRPAAASYRSWASIIALVAVSLSAPSYAAAALTLTWNDNSSSETGFKIERKTGTTGTFAQIATTAANVALYVDATVVSGTTYCYRVRAYNSAGNSAYTNEACGTAPSIVLDNGQPGASFTGSWTVSSRWSTRSARTRSTAAEPRSIPIGGRRPR